MNAALVVSARDNVATALEPLEPGRAIQVGDASVQVTESIPRGHKMALRAIPAGDPIVKYGSPIGTASMAIASGAHVHIHNVASARGRGDLAGGGAVHAAAPGRSDPRIAEPPDSIDAEPPAASPRPR
jgi:hypothetical protein